MGWTSCNTWTKKSDVINEVKNDIIKNDYTIIAAKSTRSGFWSVIEDNVTKKRIIHFALIKKDRNSFYLKTMTEWAGPADLTCPVSFFDMVECPKDGYAKEWRERVRAASIKKPKASLKVNDTIKLYGQTLKVDAYNEVIKRWIVKDENGTRYKLKPKQLTELEVVTC